SRSNPTHRMPFEARHQPWYAYLGTDSSHHNRLAATWVAPHLPGAQPDSVAPCVRDGAGEGNRTPVFSLEGCCSTIELHPHPFFRGPRPSWWRGLDSNQRRR